MNRLRAAVPLLALAATMMLAQGDQQALAQAVHGIQRQFGVSDQLVGLIPFAMAVLLAIGGIPIGVLADRVRRTWLLAAVCALWAAGMGLSAVAASFGVLFAARMLAGAAEGNQPVGISLLSDYFPVRRRAEAMGLYQAGSLVGAFAGLLLGGVAVQAGGWRWAFWMWVPAGLLVAAWYVVVPEPQRGHQDAAFEAVLGVPGVPVAPASPADPGVAEGSAAGGAAPPFSAFSLPEPRPEPPVDYANCSQLQALKALLRIPSMWYGVVTLTISQLLLQGLSFWGVEYFKRVHHLGAAAAGGLATVLGAGSAVGILAGGFAADRLLRRGQINARVYVVAFGSIAATLVLTPAFASTSLLVSGPLMFLGGIMLTVPVAPAEALMTDVVIPELRGRGGMVRQVLRTASYAGPYLVALLSGLISAGPAAGLQWGIVASCPLYALGGVIMFGALRHYPRDIAYVVAHARAVGSAAGADAGTGTTAAEAR